MFIATLRNPIRYFLFFVVALCFTSATYALGDQQPPLPPQQPTWFVSGGWLYLKPTDDTLTNIPYAETSQLNIGENTATFSTTRHHVKPSFANGFRVALGYHPQASPYEVAVIYSHINSSEINTASTPDCDDFTPLLSHMFPILDPDLIVITRGTAKLKTEYDALNVVARKKYPLWERLTLTVSGGISAAYIEEKMHVNYNGSEELLPQTVFSTNDNIDFKNDFWGVGPHLAANVFFPFIQGFGIFAKVDGSLLVGEAKSNYAENFQLNVQSPVTDFTTNTPYSDSHQSVTRFVPVLSAQVGLKLYHTFQNHIVVSLKGGYEGIKYFNAIDDSALVESVAVAATHPRFADFQLGGFFANLTVAA